MIVINVPFWAGIMLFLGVAVLSPAVIYFFSKWLEATEREKKEEAHKVILRRMRDKNIPISSGT